MGNHVAFQEAPDLHTAAHEAAHSIQQRGGVHVAGGVGQVGDRYERQADAVADRVVQGRSIGSLLGSDTSGAGSAAGSGDAPHGPGLGETHSAVQRQIEWKLQKDNGLNGFLGWVDEVIQIAANHCVGDPESLPDDLQRGGHIANWKKKASDVRSVESRSGSMGKSSAAV